MPENHIVLVGAGHAHMLLLRDRRFLASKPQITVIDATGRFEYSGLATGVLGGMYEPAFDSVEVEPLVQQFGGRFVVDRVRHVHRESRCVELAGGAIIKYGVASFNIGSEPKPDEIDGAREHAWAVKPIDNLFRLRETVEARFVARSDTVRAAVIGGGSTGCEVAANLVDLGRRRAHAIEVTLVHSGSRLIPDWTASAGRAIHDELESAGVVIRLDARVDRIESDRIRLDRGQLIPAEFVVIANGLRSPDLFRRAGLDVDEDGAMFTRPTLQSSLDDAIFGVGDCASVLGHPRPRLGVFAVRAAPILRHNLLAYNRSRRLKDYCPQQQYLSVINLGRGRGLAMRGRCYWRGRRAMDLKDRIDRRFLAKIRASND